MSPDRIDTGNQSGLHSLLIQGIFFFTVVSVVGLTVSIALSSIAMGTAIILFLTYLIVSGVSAFPATKLDLFILLYCIAELLASAFSLEPSASFFNMKRLFLISFVYLVLVAFRNTNKLLITLGLLIGITSIISIVEMFLLESVDGHFMRVNLFQYFLTESGIKMIALLLILPFVIHPQAPRLWKYVGIASSVLILIGLILSQTRSSWLGLAAGMITIGILKSKKAILVLLVFLTLFVLFAPSDFKNRAASIFDLQNRSNLSRIHMITTGWQMFLDYPIVGVGDIDLKKLYITYIEPLEEGEGGHLHNNIMMLLVTLGVVGSIATTALFIRIGQVELNALRTTGNHWLYGSLTMGSFAAYIGFHINGLFEWNFGDHEIAVLLWFTVGLSLVSEKLFIQSSNADGINAS